MYNAILKWSLAQQDEQPDESSSAERVQSMSQERKDWLKKALAHYVVDETQRMKDIVTILEFKPQEHTPVVSELDEGSSRTSGTSSTTKVSYMQILKDSVDAKMSGSDPNINKTLNSIPREALVEIRVQALDELDERIEQIDNALYFGTKDGGDGRLPLLCSILEHGEDVEKVGAATVLGTLFQNNPDCQLHALLSTDTMPHLLQSLRTATSENVRVKVLTALSALLRTPEREGLDALEKHDGLNTLNDILRESIEKKDSTGSSQNFTRMQSKVFFLLQYFFHIDKSFAKVIGESEILSTMGKCALDKDLNVSENALKCLHSIVSADKHSITRLNKNGFKEDLANAIKRLSSVVKNKEESHEYSRDVLEISFRVMSAMSK